MDLPPIEQPKPGESGLSKNQVLPNTLLPLTFSEDDGVGRGDRAKFQNWFMGVCGMQISCLTSVVSSRNVPIASLHSMALGSSVVSAIVKDPFTYFTKESRPVDGDKEPVKLLPGHLFSDEEFKLWRARLCRAADGRASPFVFLAPGGQPVLLCPPQSRGEQVTADKSATIDKGVKKDRRTKDKAKLRRKKKEAESLTSESEEAGSGSDRAVDFEEGESVESTSEGDPSSEELYFKAPAKATRKRVRQLVTSDPEDGSVERTLSIEQSSRIRKKEKPVILLTTRSKHRSKPSGEPIGGQGETPASRQSPTRATTSSKRKQEESTLDPNKRHNPGSTSVNPNRLCMSPEDLVRKVDSRFNAAKVGLIVAAKGPD